MTLIAAQAGTASNELGSGGRDVFNEKPTQEDLEGHQQQQVAKLGNVAKVTTGPWHTANPYPCHDGHSHPPPGSVRVLD